MHSITKLTMQFKVFTNICHHVLATYVLVHEYIYNHSMYINLNFHTWHPLDSESIMCYNKFHKDASTHVGVLLCVLKYIESIYKQLKIRWVSLLDICLNMEQFVTCISLIGWLQCKSLGWSLNAWVGLLIRWSHADKQSDPHHSNYKLNKLIIWL